MSRKASNRKRREAYLATVQAQRDFDPADAQFVRAPVRWPMVEHDHEGGLHLRAKVQP